jgi:hypothetical protein
VERARRLDGVTVLDESGPKMLLVECEEDAPPELAEMLPDWVIAPEQMFDVPDVRKRVRDP